ncbi:hypothetical protein [Spirulina subsalsa]|uniref:hypothetical protein n=1 Tax=Spirulina subsalsa TaxID=54311 RepID=UPI0002DA9CF9|nr:hypothetical protein [Spirulina subsalsa]
MNKINSLRDTNKVMNLKSRRKPQDLDLVALTEDRDTTPKKQSSLKPDNRSVY